MVESNDRGGLIRINEGFIVDGKGPTSLFKLFLSDHGATPPMCIVVCSVVMMMCEYPYPKTTNRSKVLYTVGVRARVCGQYMRVCPNGGD